MADQLVLTEPPKSFIPEEEQAFHLAVKRALLLALHELQYLDDSSLSYALNQLTIV